jgi:ABC-type uncharacterized transport system substrate-binding protein
MDRRTFGLFLAGSFVVCPLSAFAQASAKVRRIGYMNLRSGPNEMDAVFIEAMRELGYVEGRNLIIEYRFAAGNEERLKEMAADLVSQNVDLIVVVATPVVRAAKETTSTVPIVIAAVPDPVNSGLVASLARPGGNITGMTILTTELAPKRLQLVRELVPNATRVAVLVALGLSPQSGTALMVAELRAASKQLGVELFVHEVSNADDLADGFASMRRERVQMLIVQASPLTVDLRKQIADLSARDRLPALYEFRNFVDAGGLLSYGPSLAESFRRAATYVDKILRGAKPADLPIEQPTKFELVINLKTAKALGLTIPQSLLARADEVIQ